MGIEELYKPVKVFGQNKHILNNICREITGMPLPNPNGNGRRNTVRIPERITDREDIKNLLKKNGHDYGEEELPWGVLFPKPNGTLLINPDLEEVKEAQQKLIEDVEKALKKKDNKRWLEW